MTAEQQQLFEALAKTEALITQGLNTLQTGLSMAKMLMEEIKRKVEEGT